MVVALDACFSAELARLREARLIPRHVTVALERSHPLDSGGTGALRECGACPSRGLYSYFDAPSTEGESTAGTWPIDPINHPHSSLASSAMFHTFIVKLLVKDYIFPVVYHKLLSKSVITTFMNLIGSSILPSGTNISAEGCYGGLATSKRPKSRQKSRNATDVSGRCRGKDRSFSCCSAASQSG